MQSTVRSLLVVLATCALGGVLRPALGIELTNNKCVTTTCGQASLACYPQGSNCTWCNSATEGSFCSIQLNNNCTTTGDVACNGARYSGICTGSETCLGNNYVGDCGKQPGCQGP
ncbi:MAG: hypothetical protein AB7Q17_01645 [Phycisphaerae bacterium]